MIQFDNVIWFKERNIRPTDILQSKIEESRNGVEHPQGNYDFTSKIENWSNTADPLLPVNSLIGKKIFITYAPCIFLLGGSYRYHHAQY